MPPSEPKQTSHMMSTNWPNTPSTLDHHMLAVKQVFKYLNATQDTSITYGEDHDLEVYSDANWGDDSDDCHLQSGYVCLYAGGAITWNSKKQPTITLSSIEAEYMALANSTKEILWLRKLFTKLGLATDDVTNILVNNQGTISFAQNLNFHA